MKRQVKRTAACLIALTMLWQSGSFACALQSGGASSVLPEPSRNAASMKKTSAAEPASDLSAASTSEPAIEGTLGTALRAGDHIVLGAGPATGGSAAGNGLDGAAGNTLDGAAGAREAEAGGLDLVGTGITDGYDFTVLTADPEESDSLLLLTNPLGLEESPQQFDAAWEGADSDHPDEDSQLDGCSLWTESDLYTALNGSTKAGNTDVHGANVGAARSFCERLSANADEWEALLPHTDAGSDGEKVSLLSELEFETYRGEIGAAFWYTEEEASGFWLKTARPSYTSQVRYIYSGTIPPSLTSDAYYAIARETRAVRPALRLDLRRVMFGAGNGTAEDPYRELALRPPVTLTLHIESWNPQTAAQASLMEETEGENAGRIEDGSTPAAAADIAFHAESTTQRGIGRCTQTIVLDDVAAGVSLTLEISKWNHIPYRKYAICLTEDTELTVVLPCGDVNGDGSIDLLDRQLLLSAMQFDSSAAKGERKPPDLDGDGRVSLTDLYILMLTDNFGKRVRVR